MLGKTKAKGEGAAEDKMVTQHHLLNGQEFEKTLGDRGVWRATDNGVAKSQT